MSAEVSVVIKQLISDEGFSGHPYKDILGWPTIGYGCKLPISREEGYLILQKRLENKIKALDAQIPWWRDMPTPAANAMLNMAYQLGVMGLMGFTNTLKHLRNGEYALAAQEALNSRWAEQTPERAKKISYMIQLAEGV